MGSKICKPKMMDCLTCPKNNPKESFCFDKEECSVPFAMVRDGKIIAWEENKEDKKMRCADCGLYECCMRTPLGGCPNGEKADPSRIYTTPNTDHGPFERGNQPSGMLPIDEILASCPIGAEPDSYLHGYINGYTDAPPEDAFFDAALALVDAVERYMRQECLRSELANIKDNLKKLIK